MNSKTFGMAAISAVVISLSVSANAAKAATFSFSYTFLSGESIAGTIDGELQPDNNTVGNLSNLSASYSGQPGTLLRFVAPSSFRQSFTLAGTQNFQLYGFANDPNTSVSQPNFGFFLGGPSDISNGATVGTFFTSFLSAVFPGGSDRREAEKFSASRWTVTAHSTTPVPEPAPLAGLVLVGVGIATVRSRQQRTKATELPG